MNWKARQLGMKHTWYRNASGLPDPEQRTTARDIARLALALYHQFPREYRYFSTREFDFRGEIVRGHDHLLDWYPGADGIKTGFINASGFNLASLGGARRASADRRDHGRAHGRSRDVQMASLLDQGFAVLAAGQPAQPRYAPRSLPLRRRRPATAADGRRTRARPIGSAHRRRPRRGAEAAGAQQRSGFLGNVAQAALRHLSPVARAEAAPLGARGIGR